MFPFGHGLSYTTFEYSNLRTPASIRVEEIWQVSVTIKNSGGKAGSEVVQLYIHDIQSSLKRPLKELKGFIKINLQPGEAQEVTFELNDRSLAFYDPVEQDWVVEPGEFEILVGSSSRDIRITGKVNVTGK